MQPHDKQSTPPPEEQESIQYYVLEGLFPPTHSFVLNLALLTFLHLYWEEKLSYPLVLRPRLSQYPQFAPYEIIHASFHEGYDRLSE